MDAIVRPTVRATADKPGYHHGIRYSVREVAPGRWQWAVYPPEGVLGWEQNGSTITGSRSDAILVAKFDIERQERRAK
jgi:hypothetical protein